MTSIRSLGLHEPSALSYLVAESILPAEPHPSLYRWTCAQVADDKGNDLVQEEILTTKYCVVWSRNGAIKRTLNLDVEGESIIHALVTSFPPDDSRQASTKERGLVVILKTQAHIFLLSGDSYVLPLTFEVESAWPCRFGLLLQRKLCDGEVSSYLEPAQHDLSTINETLTSVGGNSSRPSLILPEKHHSPAKLPRANANGMPRTFSFTDVMSELALVVCSSHRKGELLDDCNALPRSEKLVFVSNEACSTVDSIDTPALCMAVTLNETTSTFTLWHIAKGPVAGSRRQKSEKDAHTKSRLSLRKSSNIYGRDTGTLRESLLSSRQGFLEAATFPSLEEKKSFPSNDLTSQLGPEFGDVGVQTRSARRVSSMIARTDLGSAPDRNTFNDLASGLGGRQSLNRAAKRGESIGSFNDRQSFGLRRRSSFPTNASMFSTGTSFLDASAHGLLEEMDPLRHSNRVPQDSLDTSDSKLPRILGFFKIKSFPRNQMSVASELEVDISGFVLNAPHVGGLNSHQNEVHLCLVDKPAHEMTMIKVLVKSHHTRARPHTTPSCPLELKATEIRRLPGIKDACKIVDKDVQRLAILTQSRSSNVSLHLEAPWSPSSQIELPEQYAVHDPLLNSQASSPRKDKSTGIRRVISGSDVRIEALLNSGMQRQIFAIDQESRSHSLGVSFIPNDAFIHKMLQVCGMVLGPDQEETLLVAFWDVCRWLKSHDPPLKSEWTAFVVMLFSLAVPFIGNQHSQTTPTRRKKAGLLRSSSGIAVDLTSYNAMHHEEYSPSFEAANRSSAWNWLTPRSPRDASFSPRAKLSTGASTVPMHDSVQERKNPFLSLCTNLAREYIQSPLGEAALGPEGYLPTSINKDREQRCNALPNILLALHLLYEESKLNLAASSNLKGSRIGIVPVLAQLGCWLGWKDWTCNDNTYYCTESQEAKDSSFNNSCIDGLRIPNQPFPPPSIFQHLEDWITKGESPSFLTLARVSDSTRNLSYDERTLQSKASFTPRTMAILTFMDEAKGQLGPQKAADSFLSSHVSEHFLSTLPDGVVVAFCQAASSNRMKTAMNSGSQARSPDGRDSGVYRDHDFGHTVQKQFWPSHEATRDYHTVCSTALDAESLQRWDASSEADRQAITKLLFAEDRRFQEASKLVNQTRPPVVECTPEPDWSEVDLLEAQKELAQHAARRTLSVAAGRGMMHFTARVPLLTERVPIPAFSLQCIMKPRNATESSQAMTFSADKATFTEEKVCWAFFHNGASMGLMISSAAQGIDTSWILYNKPPELTNRHAGFLLALGLNGHLKSLAKWVTIKYLTPKHTMTSVGLLLGLSASFLGTMDTLVTRLLSVHVTRLMPPGAAELNLSPLTQTTGIMGIGLLYYGSQHRRMSEVMLSEIENNDPEEGAVPENVLRDEGYRLAAGFALGLINLGQGKNLHGLHDVGIVDRLLTIAVGTKNVNMVHVLDRATAGAVMALGFVFLKTNNVSIATKVDVPDTLHQFDYVRPDIFLLRTLARHLIMWDSIRPTQGFIRMSLPQPYRRRGDLRATKGLSTEDMPFFNILAGICFAIGLRFAGSQRHDVRDLLVSYLDQFLRLSRTPAHNYDARVALNSVRNCLDTVALASASVMAGSGDIQVMRRLRAMHGRIDKETPFGSHLAAHMALGALFLAGGTRTFGTSSLAIAALCIAFYPVFPNDVLDNRGHLQALRHLWVLAVEGRCLVARDGDARGSVVGGVTGLIRSKDGNSQTIYLPGLIPDFNTIRTIEIRGVGFWDGLLDFEKGGEQLLSQIKRANAVNVILRRRAAYDQPPRDFFTAELQAKAKAAGIPSVDRNAVPSSSIAQQASTNSNPFEWLFHLKALQDFDHAEQDLVLESLPLDGKDLLRTTVVDARLGLEKGILPPDVEVGRMQKHDLWQLRLLFAWFDRWGKEDSDLEGLQLNEPKLGESTVAKNGWFGEDGGAWLRREVIERLRWRVWNMTTNRAGNHEHDHTSSDHEL